MYPTGALASGRSIKVQVTHSHEHDHGDHEHHSHESNEQKDESKHEGSSHTHEVLVSCHGPGYLSAQASTIKLNSDSVASLPLVEHHSQLGQRLSSIFRPPIC